MAQASAGVLVSRLLCEGFQGVRTHLGDGKPRKETTGIMSVRLRFSSERYQGLPFFSEPEEIHIGEISSIDYDTGRIILTTLSGKEYHTKHIDVLPDTCPRALPHRAD